MYGCDLWIMNLNFLANFLQSLGSMSLASCSNSSLSGLPFLTTTEKNKFKIYESAF